MAELYVLGELERGVHFESKSLACEYQLISSVAWTKEEGVTEGESAFDTPQDRDFEGHIFSYPFEFHLEGKSMADWPSVRLSLYTQDSKGQKQLVAQGSFGIPFEPGTHDLVVKCWRFNRDKALINGEVATPGDGSIIGEAEPNEIIEASGEVIVRLYVLVSGFEERGIVLTTQ